LKRGATIRPGIEVVAPGTLVRSGTVSWVGPEGDALGRLDLASVRRLLHERLERRLDPPAAELARLQATSRVGRA